MHNHQNTPLKPTARLTVPFIVFLILLSAGCTQSHEKTAYYVCWDEQIVETPAECTSMASEVRSIVTEKTRYVCPDETIVDTPSKCPEPEIDAETLKTLKERLASGEITPEEFEKTKQLLLEE
jgi:hypothetical protein